ncbi:AAA family ATPase [Streptacidiphilus rugosus]|uniref:AAA family ATPase n=1 Tax=Streptacidiphilus rugosus TaxID=405783 RepID=UPI0005675CA7|nr:AAA family ATPase [Streptacidiphilus rugosus]
MADVHEPSGGPAGLFRFVGRTRESDLLLAAARHPPATVLVEGEAGIGESRLVREAAAVPAREQRCVLFCYCHPLREPLAYGPVVDALHKAGPWLPASGLPPATAALGRLLPDLADRLPAPPPAPGTPRSGAGFHERQPGHDTGVGRCQCRLPPPGQG